MENKICNKCKAINSIKWDKKEIMIDDKNGTCVIIELNFCEECGDITSYEVY